MNALFAEWNEEPEVEYENKLYCQECNMAFPVGDLSLHTTCTNIVSRWSEFIGWREDDELGPIPLYNICGYHPRSGSTVDANALVREGIRIPDTPLP